MSKNKNHNVRRFGKLALVLTTLVLGSCITVNVNFPESAVQRAADDFVRDLYRGTTAVAEADTKVDAKGDAAAVKSSVKKSSKKKSEHPAPSDVAKPGEPHGWIIDFGIASAHAQELNMHSPKAESIKARMKGRVGEIAKWKSKGAICETSDAMLVFKSPDKAGGEAASVSKLVQSENADRDELYQEIQEVNKIQDRKQTKIRKFFAAAFRENSPAGTCFE